MTWPNDAKPITSPAPISLSIASFLLILDNTVESTIIVLTKSPSAVSPSRNYINSMLFIFRN